MGQVCRSFLRSPVKFCISPAAKELSKFNLLKHNYTKEVLGCRYAACLATGTSPPPKTSEGY